MFESGETGNKWIIDDTSSSVASNMCCDFDVSGGGNFNLFLRVRLTTLSFLAFSMKIHHLRPSWRHPQFVARYSITPWPMFWCFAPPRLSQLQQEAQVLQQQRGDMQSGTPSAMTWWLVARVADGTYMDVSKNRGTPNWMVYNGKPY